MIKNKCSVCPAIKGDGISVENNLVIIHGGGPTAVINASLYGVIRQARREAKVGRVLAAIGGTGGLLAGHVRDVTDLSAREMALLLQTPAAPLAPRAMPWRGKIMRAWRQKIAELGAAYVLLNGGNGTMDTCGKLCAQLRGTDVRVMGIPKTMDNDIAVTDHAPGYGSAARYFGAERCRGDGGCAQPADPCRCHRGKRAQCGLDYGRVGAGAHGRRGRAGSGIRSGTPF